MADLKGIIKLRKHRLDEKRRALAELNDQRDRLVQAREKLDKDLAREQEAASGAGGDAGEDGTMLAGWSYGNYQKAALQRRKQLDEAIRQMEQRIEKAREEIRDAFAELKKFEITQRERQRREDAEQKRKEDEELNEIGIEGYRRREEQD